MHRQGASGQGCLWRTEMPGGQGRGTAPLQGKATWEAPGCGRLGQSLPLGAVLLGERRKKDLQEQNQVVDKAPWGLGLGLWRQLPSLAICSPAPSQPSLSSPAGFLRLFPPLLLPGSD